MSKVRGQEETITRIQEIDRYEFEDFVAEIFDEAGWDTEVTQDSGDGGVDVVARRYTFVEEKASIQVKRPDRGNKVGRPDLQQYASIDRDDPDTDFVVVVTSSPFSTKGYEYGAENNIKLIDGAMLAGFIEAQDATSKLDSYAPPIEDIDVEEEVFSPAGEYREDYLRKRPVEASTRLFNAKDLLDAVDIIRDSEVGKQQIEALDELRESIEAEDKHIPEPVFAEYPQFVDENWYDVRSLDDVAETIREAAKDHYFTPEDYEVIVFCHNESISVQVLLPCDSTVSRKEYEFLESCVDAIPQIDAVNEDDPDGRVFGCELESVRGKLERNKTWGIVAKTYPKVLERSINTNNELLNAVRPYFRASENEEIIEKIERLQAFAQDNE
ncbi:restriction endonuclease [Halobacterium rubrum]|uniref:restriction endonuclease n=1 Tax=Halobacterium TaxID=2239 RepID=UPI001F15B34A|nr:MULTISPECIES: restriction endonuclease [Halobacterium]MDH5019018.1 restriction endonuclease [Halobacterium rubrum]